MKLIFLIGLVFFSALTALPQAPIINSVTPISGYPTSKLLITGSGFSTNPANLRVSFDHVNGAISVSSDFSIEVTVPSQARMSNVEVTNLVSGLSAKSPLKFVPAYSGTDFNAAQIASPLSIASASEVFDVCSCDLDGDGKPDLTGTKQGTLKEIMIARNTSTTGTLSFAVPLVVPITDIGINLACGDLNGDGKPELVVSRGGATRNEIFVLRNMSSVGSISFAPLTTLFMDVGHFSFRIVIRDLNMDGKPEVIVSNAFDDATNTNNTIYVFVNQSAGGILNFNATPVKLTVTGANTTYGLDVQDLDGDKKPEIIVNPFASSNIFVLKNISSAGVAFTASQQINLSGNLLHLTTADFNEDGKLDVAVTSSLTDNKTFVLLNQSSAGTISFGPAITLTTGSSPWGIDAGDADGDGDMDILVGNRGTGAVDLTLFKSNGNNSGLAFTPSILSAGKKSRNVRMGDFDGDGKPDFAYTTDASNSLDIIRNKNCFIPSILNTAPLTICAPQTIQLNTVPNLGVTDYAWKESVNPPVSSGTNPFFNIMASGSYTVIATSESGACVTTSAALVVASGAGALPANPSISSNSPVCSGQTLQLNEASTGFTYSWTGPNGFTSALKNPQIVNSTEATAGIYSLQLFNGACQSNIATTRVDIANLSNFSISTSVLSNIVCQGSSLTLSVNAQTGHTYQWIKDGTDIGSQTGTSFAVTQSGAYSVRVTNTALACSSVTAPVNAIVLAPPVAAFTVNPEACVGQSLSFTDQSTKDALAIPVYLWSFGDGATATTVGNTNHSYTAAASTVSTSLAISYTGVVGCSNAAIKNIAIIDTPTIVVSSDKTSLVAGELAQLQASGATSYAWSPPDGLSAVDIENPVASPVIATLYTVTGTTSNCSSTGTINIDVTGLPPASGSIPNVFSPNGDGINDFWVFANVSAFVDCTLTLFDTAGRKIFEKKGYNNDWDGTYTGKEAPQGTYFYVMGCPDAEPLTGHVLIAR